MHRTNRKHPDADGITNANEIHERIVEAMKAEPEPLNRQQIEKAANQSPEVKRAERQQWEEMPENARALVDELVGLWNLGRKPAALFRSRRHASDSFFTGGLEALRAEVEETRGRAEENAKSHEEWNRKMAEKKAARERRRAERNSPEAKLRRERRRAERAVELLRMVENGTLHAYWPSARTRCVWCQRPLTDPVSQERGLGTGCYSTMRALAEHLGWEREFRQTLSGEEGVEP